MMGSMIPLVTEGQEEELQDPWLFHWKLGLVYPTIRLVDVLIHPSGLTTSHLTWWEGGVGGKRGSARVSSGLPLSQ